MGMKYFLSAWWRKIKQYEVRKKHKKRNWKYTETKQTIHWDEKWIVGVKGRAHLLTYIKIDTHDRVRIVTQVQTPPFFKNILLVKIYLI